MPAGSQAIPSPMFQDDNSGDPASTCSDQNSFSLRDYVLAARKEDISHNWPFPLNYLHMCIERGVSKVLPPFDSRRLAIRDNITAITKIEGTDGQEGEIANVSEQVSLLSLSSDRNEPKKDKCSEDSAAKFGDHTINSKMRGTDESELDHELLEVSSLHQDDGCELSDLPSGMVSCVTNLQVQTEVDDLAVHDRSVSGNEDDIGSTVGDQIPELGHEVNQKARNSFANTNLSSGKKTSENKRRRKGKPKKRTMADICARARPSSLEDLDRVNASNLANDSSLMPYSSLSYGDNICAFDEKRRSLSTFDESKLQVSSPTKKHPRDDSLRDRYLLVKKRRIMVKKLTGVSKSCKKNLRI